MQYNRRESPHGSPIERDISRKEQPKQSEGFRLIASSENQSSNPEKSSIYTDNLPINQAIRSTYLGDTKGAELYLQIQRIKGWADVLPNKFEDPQVHLVLIAQNTLVVYSPLLIGRSYKGLLEGIPVCAYLAQITLSKTENYLILTALDAREEKEAAQSYALLIAKALEDCVKHTLREI